MNKELLKIQLFCISEIEKIEADDRYQMPPADVGINAFLALVQVTLKTTRTTLKEVLNEIEKLKNENSSSTKA